ncbi:MAG: phosphatidate cytidylyltransferase [Planctomycetes bacterium]|nr:phosphatidate cytidylyltransferase [Planctomycetota bacterium]
MIAPAAPAPPPTPVMTRVAFGVGLVALVAAILALDHHYGSANGFTAIIAFIVLVGLREFFAMARRLGYEPASRWTTFCGLALIGEFWMRAYGIDTYELAQWANGLGPGVFSFLKVLFSPHVQWSLVVLLFAVGVFFLTVTQFRDKAFENVGVSVFGMFYIPYLLSLSLHLRSMKAPPRWEQLRATAGVAGALSYGEWLVVITIAVARGGDIFAYFTGRACGRNKLIPRVSPGKTIEGAVGGLFGSLLLALVIRGLGLPNLSLAQAAIFGVAIGAAGQLGDLMESVLKRKAGVKDSGRLVPGFGGLLDIIDNFMVAVPVALLLLLVWGAG